MDGILLMLASDVTFAIMAAAMKFTGQTLPAVEVVFIRSAVSLLALTVILRSQKISLIAREPGLLWARGVIGYLALQSYFWALPQIALGTAVMLNYTAPVFAVILSFFFLREKSPSAVKLFLAVSFVGVYLLCSPEIGGKPWPLLAGLLSGLLAGSVHVMIRQGNRSDSPLLIIFYFAFCSTIGSGCLLLFRGWQTPTGPEWLGLLVITLTSFAGQLFLTYALQKAPVWVVSPFGYFTPVLGLWLGWWLWGEKIGALSVIGSALVIVSGSVMLNFFRRLKKIPQAT